MDELALLSIKTNKLISLLSKINPHKSYMKMVGDFKLDDGSYVPHVWIIDSNNNNLDEFGRDRFVKTGLASDIDERRYVKPVTSKQTNPNFIIAFGPGFATT